jgi:anti-sigma B factor antagonist
MSASMPGPGRLKISRIVDNGTVSLALEGELDLAGAPEMEASLVAVERDEPTRLVIDLSRLQFIDSTGLRLLLQADARAKELGYELVLRPGMQAVQRVFEVTGALAILRFEGSPED